MKHLYFQHSNKTFSLVHKNVGDETDTNVWILIFHDIRKKNPAFHVLEKTTYTDIAGRRWFDVGSKEERYVIF